LKAQQEAEQLTATKEQELQAQREAAAAAAAAAAEAKRKGGSDGDADSAKQQQQQQQQQQQTTDTGTGTGTGATVGKTGTTSGGSVDKRSAEPVQKPTAGATDNKQQQRDGSSTTSNTGVRQLEKLKVGEFLKVGQQLVYGDATVTLTGTLHLCTSDQYARYWLFLLSHAIACAIALECLEYVLNP
jgi:hypothetical protein